MSKKIIAFTLPAARTPHQALEDIARNFDDWVHEEKQEVRDEIEARPASGSGPVLIDLSVRRSWFELMQLVAVFPYIASWQWMIQMAETALETSKQRVK